MKINYIGIPRFLYYSKYKDFVRNYFEYLGYNVIIGSKNINKSIITNRCSIYTKYINNIENIRNKCDLLVIPHINNLTSIEKYCPILENIHTIMSKNYNNIFTFNLKYPLTIISNTLKINKNIPKIIVSYILARIDYNKQKKKRINIQNEILKNIRKKILIVTNDYYDYENNIFINSKYDIIYSKYLNEKIALDYFQNYSNTVNIIFIKIMIGSIYYYHYSVEKIIVFYPKHCKYDINNYLKYLENEIKNKITIINF